MRIWKRRGIEEEEKVEYGVGLGIKEEVRVVMMIGRCIYIFLGLWIGCRLYIILIYIFNFYVLLIDICNDFCVSCNLFFIVIFVIRFIINFNFVIICLFGLFFFCFLFCFVMSFNFGNYFIGDVEYILCWGIVGVIFG